MKVSRFDMFGKKFFVVKDDTTEFLLDGNKGYKVRYLLNDFNLKKALSSVSKNNNTIVSFGSNQSNAMASLSRFCYIKGIDFIYITDHSPKNITKDSNLDLAIKYGANIIHSSPQDYSTLAKEIADKNGYLLINEGVCEEFAQYGFKDLATKITNHFKSSDEFDVFLPSGTGTSAIYLQKYLKTMQVFTTPCFKDEDFLKDMIKTLDPSSKLLILNPPKKYVFGKLYKELYDIIMFINKVSLMDFELIYDSVGFMAILNNLNLLKENIIYIHQGGKVGHKSQLLRYENKYKG